MSKKTKIPAEPAPTQVGRASAAGWRNPWLGYALIAALLLGVGLVLYANFVFGPQTLLYKDIGSDSLNVFYPNYVLRSNYLRQHGLFSWSFQVGMGQDISHSIGNFLLTPVIWLPQKAIAEGLIFQHLFYVIMAGMFFGRFLVDRGASLIAALLGSLLLSFSSYMCMGSCWYFHAYEVVCFSFLLFATERAISRRRWIWLVAGVAGTGLLGAFHFYLCALFLSIYVPLRLFAGYGWQPAALARTVAALACAALLGVGLTSIFTLGGLYAQFNSPRGAGPTSRLHQLISTPVFELCPSLHYVTALLRPFANDILGTGSDFEGWQNYLEAPMSYCGLLCLVLIPQAVLRGSRRSRIVCNLFLSAVILTTALPWFRYLFWAFQGDYYRTLSLFSILGIITLSIKVFGRYVAGIPLNLWLLAATLLALFTILYLPWPGSQGLVQLSVRTGRRFLPRRLCRPARHWPTPA